MGLLPPGLLPVSRRSPGPGLRLRRIVLDFALLHQTRRSLQGGLWLSLGHAGPRREPSPPLLTLRTPSLLPPGANYRDYPLPRRLVAGARAPPGGPCSLRPRSG